MVNKSKQKRRLSRSLARRPKETEKYLDEKRKRDWRNYFVRAGILK